MARIQIEYTASVEAYKAKLQELIALNETLMRVSNSANASIQNLNKSASQAGGTSKIASQANTAQKEAEKAQKAAEAAEKAKVKAAEAAENAKVKAAEKAAKERERIEKQAARERERVEKQAARAAEAAEKQRTRAAEKEANQRRKSEEREAAFRRKTMGMMGSEEAERRRTKYQQQESEKRIRQEQREARERSNAQNQLEAKLRSTFGVFNNIRAFVASAFAIGSIKTFAEQVVQLVAELEILQSRINFIYGSESGGKAGFLRLSTAIKDLGLDFKTTVEQFTTFNIAAQQANFTTVESEQMFIDFAASLRAVGASNLQVQRAFYALQQMMSKGVVAAEELRRQMGEALPGAGALMFKAFKNLHPELVQTERDFMKLQEEGKILSREVLPEFVKVVKEEFSPALESKKGSLVASIERAEMAWMQFKAALLETGPVISVLQTFTETVSKLNRELQYLKETQGEGGDGGIFSNLTKGLIGREGQYAIENTASALGKLSGSVDILKVALMALKDATQGVFSGKLGASSLFAMGEGGVIRQPLEEQYERQISFAKKLNEIEIERNIRNLQTFKGAQAAGRDFLMTEKEAERYREEHKNDWKQIFEQYNKGSIELLAMFNAENKINEATERQLELQGKLDKFNKLDEKERGDEISRVSKRIAELNQAQSVYFQGKKTSIKLTKEEQLELDKLLELFKNLLLADTALKTAPKTEEKATKGGKDPRVAALEDEIAAQKALVLQEEERIEIFNKDAKNKIKTSGTLVVLNEKLFELEEKLDKLKAEGEGAKSLATAEKELSITKENVALQNQNIDLAKKQLIERLEAEKDAISKRLAQTKEGSVDEMNVRMELMDKEVEIEIAKNDLIGDARDKLVQQNLKNQKKMLSDSAKNLEEFRKKVAEAIQAPFLDETQLKKASIMSNFQDLIYEATDRKNLGEISKQEFQNIVKGLNDAMQKALEDVDGDSKSLFGLNDEQLRQIKDALNIVGNAFKDLYDVRMELARRANEAELEMLDKRLNAGLMRENEYNEKVAEVKKRQALAERDAAKFGIVLNTAQGIANVWSKFGAVPPVAAALTALLVGVSAAQLNAVNSAPLPTFHEGGLDIRKNSKKKPDNGLKSDEFYAKLQEGESVMTREETRKYKDVLKAIREDAMPIELMKAYKLPAYPRSIDKPSLMASNSTSLELAYQNAELVDAVKRNGAVTIRNANDIAEAIVSKSSFMKIANRRRIK